MAAPNYTITFDTGFLMDLSKGINKTVMPLLHQTVQALANQTAADWQHAVHKAKLWSGEKDAYAASITATMTGDFSAVVESDYKHAYAIENGRPARDLKAMLNTSTKVRRTLDGRRFLIIPFRHNTPGNTAHGPSMPDHVYQAAQLLKPSKIIGQGQRPAGEVTRLSPKTGMHAAGKQSPFLSNPATKSPVLVNKNVYAWGQRMLPGSMGPNPKGKKDRFAGMYRFETSTPGGGKSSAYMTFRVMMEGSSGWVVGAQPGLFLARKVAQDMQPKAQAAFAAAAAKMGG